MNFLKKLTLKMFLATLAMTSLNLHHLDAMFIHARTFKQFKTYRLNSSSFIPSTKSNKVAKCLAIGIAVTAWLLTQEDISTDDVPELENNPDQEIIMRIYPGHITSLGYSCYGYPCHAKLLTFEGFKAGQVCLISDDKTPAFLSRFIYQGETYTPSDFRKILDNDPTCPYPSHFHKKLNYLPDGARLTILRYDQEEPTEVDLSPEVKDRLLQYLLHDFEDDIRDCYDFFREIMFEQPDANNETLVSPMRELDLNPGDGVILFDFTKKPDEARHFAIALGDRLYMSRLGRGRPIFVTDMRSMMKLYECPIFAKASPNNE